MDQLPQFGTEIGKSVEPTRVVYAPLLLQNAEQIRSVKKETFSYGPSPRHQLDVYTPPRPSVINGRQAVFVFAYGGGLVRGDKTLHGFADGLMHANVGSFFALQLGYTVVIPDYRLVGTHQDAVFPSGGEDIALTVQWIQDHHNNISEGPLDLFMMGNSAGAIHLSTFMLHPSFASVRQSALSSTNCRLRGVIYLSAPFDTAVMPPVRIDIINAYFGGINETSPIGLLRTARKNGTLDFVEAGCRTLILNAELDPLDEVQAARDGFIREWLAIETNEARVALTVDMMIGHNHISPVCGLGTGIDREEAWGYQVGVFVDSQRRLGRP